MTPIMRTKPRNRRVAPADCLRAVARVLIHIAAGDDSVMKDHAEDVRTLEAYNAESLPPSREPLSSLSVSDEGGDDEADAS